MSWFGGPDDPTSGPTTASGRPVTDPGIAVYNTATLNGYWRVHFPNGRTAVLQQTDIGPAPWTGRVLDVLYSALPYPGYAEPDFPTGAPITATYLGSSPQLARLAIGGGGAATTTGGGGDCSGGTLTGDRSLTAITAAANLLASMHLPYSYGGGHITPAKPTLGLGGAPPVGLECSSSVSFVLQHAGFNVPTMVSGSFETWGDPGPDRDVTLYASSWHIFMKIGDRYFGTSGSGLSPSRSTVTPKSPPGQGSTRRGKPGIACRRHAAGTSLAAVVGDVRRGQRPRPGAARRSGHQRAAQSSPLRRNSRTALIPSATAAKMLAGSVSDGM